MINLFSIYYFSDGNPKFTSIQEPGCLSIEKISTMDYSRGLLKFGSSGFVGFSSPSKSSGGLKFEIKYECPKPCADQKSKKFCKKQEKKGNCKKASINKKCKKTCGECWRLIQKYAIPFD